VEDARREARGSGRGVFIELFSPKCLGCQNMEMRTFASFEVAEYLMENFVPVHFDVLKNPEYLNRFNAFWTPTFIFQDGDGDEVRRSIGFLPPDKFLAEMALARVACALNAKHYAPAHVFAQDALEECAHDPVRHAEALYWLAVTAYKSTNNQDLLIDGWRELLDTYPDSDWAARCDFVRDLS
jgi:hypothetical protein